MEQQGDLCGGGRTLVSSSFDAGSVSPFGLIFDTEKRVTVVLDRIITFAPEEELVNFHPNRNTATLGLSKGDFLHFLRYMGNSVIFEK